MTSPSRTTDQGEEPLTKVNVLPKLSTSFSDTDSINMADESIVTFNVGGVIFQTLESTIRYPKRPVYRLKDLGTLERHWDKERSMYFFDRDPAAFQTVLNYMRTGVLHLPQSMCSPQVTTELLYWGLPRIDIQPCCWKEYSIGIQSLENLRKLEKDRCPAYANPHYFSKEDLSTSTLGRLKTSIWNIVSDPASSRVAKIYGTILLITIIISLVSLALNTMLTHAQCEVRKDFANATSEPPSEFKQTLGCHIIPIIDLVCFSIFAFDLACGLLTTPEIIKYLLSLHFWVDLMALVPDIVTIYSSIHGEEQSEEGMNTFYLFKSLRLFRVVRLMIRVTGVMTILYTIWASGKEILSLILVLCISTLIFASFVFYAERAYGNPEMTSVFDSCWWGIITLTTVGYGDVIPHSPLGRFVGSMCAFSGVILLGITVPTMVVNFITFNNIIRYMEEREYLFLYRIRGDYTKRPDIPCPDWL